MKKFELTKEDLKIREKAIEVLKAVSVINLYSNCEGYLKFSDKDLGFKCRLHQFDRILESIYQFDKKPNEWVFNINHIKVHFVLRS